MDDFRKITFGVLIGFVLMIVTWVSFVVLSGCGWALNCAAAQPKVDRTSVPTLVPATLPALVRLLPTTTPTPVPSGNEPTATAGPSIPLPSNPGGPGQAASMTGDASSGAQIFADNCVPCHNTDGTGGKPNPGSTDGTIPALNPIDPGLKSPDYKTFATNIDLFIQHGSTPEGTSPVFSMPPWGDSGTLSQQQIADVIAYLISLNP